MYGFWNRRVWMWVIAIPAIVLGALAAMGDSVIVAARFWWLSLPVLAVPAFLIWRGLDPAEQGAGPTPVWLKLVATPILLLLGVMALGLVVAFVMWLQPYWLIVGPIYGGFALLVVAGAVRDGLRERRSKRLKSNP